MKTDLDRQITAFLNWWDDHLEETGFPEGDQDDFGECAYPVTWDQDQRALVAQLCEGGCCTSVRELDGLVGALRELTGRQVPEPLPSGLLLFSESDYKVWEAEFAKAYPDFFHEDARGPGDWERVRVERQDPSPGARRAEQLPPEESGFWDELRSHLTNRESIVLWNMLMVLPPDPPARREMKQSELTAKLEYYMSQQTCERAIRMLRRRGMLWMRPEGRDTWITLTNSGSIVASRVMKQEG